MVWGEIEPGPAPGSLSWRGGAQDVGLPLIKRARCRIKASLSVVSIWPRSPEAASLRWGASAFFPLHGTPAGETNTFTPTRRLSHHYGPGLSLSHALSLSLPAIINSTNDTTITALQNTHTHTNRHNTQTYMNADTHTHTHTHTHTQNDSKSS